MKRRKLIPADRPTRRFALEIEGVGTFDEWSSAEVRRDLQDFAGTFTFTLRDATRALASLAWASAGSVFRVRPGPAATVYIDGEKVLVGWIETVEPVIDAEYAEVTISGRDKTGDLIDSAAAADGPGELKNVKLEEAAKRVAEPFGLTVRNEIDTGAPFPRYPLKLAETGHSAIERGARQRGALVTSDGVGGVVITRTGAEDAPGALVLPGNVKASSAVFTHEGRFSETIVRGQSEGAAGHRNNRARALGPADDPVDPGARSAGDGSATERERKGTAITGRATDPEITRFRPIVHLARTQPEGTSAQDEADWRSRTARANAEELAHVVHGYGEDGKLWKVNQMPEVDDAFQGIQRAMLISAIAYLYDEAGEITEITLSSPEAFDKEPTGNRRTNRKRGTTKKAKAGSGGLDGTAREL